MRLELKCGSVVPGCDFVAHAENEPDLMMRMADHTRNAHGLEHISDALKAKLKDAVVKR